MHHEPTDKGEMVMDHPEFDDAMRDKYEDKARNLDELITKLGEKERGTLDKIEAVSFKKKKERLKKISEGYWDAIEPLEGKTKIGAVKLIQELAKGMPGVEMEGVVTVDGEVWGLQTGCNYLSSWNEIIQAVGYLIAKENKKEDSYW